MDNTILLAKLLLRGKFSDFQKNFPKLDAESEKERIPKFVCYVRALINFLV